MAQAALLDHLRLYHPDAYEDVAGEAARGVVAAAPGPFPAVPFVQPVITADEAEYGVRCCRCGCRFSPGDRYTESLEGMAGWIPVVEVICMTCTGLPAPGVPFPGNVGRARHHAGMNEMHCGACGSQAFQDLTPPGACGPLRLLRCLRCGRRWIVASGRIGA